MEFVFNIIFNTKCAIIFNMFQFQFEHDLRRLYLFSCVVRKINLDFRSLIAKKKTLSRAFLQQICPLANSNQRLAVLVSQLRYYKSIR